MAQNKPFLYISELKWLKYFFISAPFAAGPLAGIFGRKLTLLSSTIFFVISWVLLATTSSVAQIYAARLIQGFGVGFVMTVQTMYIGEIAR